MEHLQTKFEENVLIYGWHKLVISVHVFIKNHKIRHGWNGSHFLQQHAKKIFMNWHAIRFLPIANSTILNHIAMKFVPQMLHKQYLDYVLSHCQCGGNYIKRCRGYAEHGPKSFIRSKYLWTFTCNGWTSG